MSSSRAGSKAMSSRHDESSMSSLSAGLSAYNAAEPKPLSDAHSRSSSKRSGGAPGPPPPPPPPGGSRGGRDGGPRDGGSVARSYHAASVASALSQGTAGRGQQAFADDDENTARLMGMVNEMTGGGGGGMSEEERMAIEEERYRLQNEIQGQLQDGGEFEGDYYESERGNMSRSGGRSTSGSRRSSHGSGGGSRGGSSNRRSSVDPDTQSRMSSYRGGGSQDPDEASKMSRRSNRSSGVPPPPPPRSTRGGSVATGTSSRGGAMSRSKYDPDGMSNDFAADDPDGRHYAPGSRNGGPPSVGRSRQSQSSRPTRYEDEDPTYYSGASRGTYDDYPPEGEDYPPEGEDGTYYTRDSQTRRSVPPNAEELTQFTNGQDEPTQYSRDESGASRSNTSSSYQSGTKRSPRPVPIKKADNNKRAMWWYNFSRCVTFPFPDSCIRKEDADAKQAWREKVAICFCVLLASGFFVGIFGFVPVLLCRERTVYTLDNVKERTSEDWIVVNGLVYDVGGLFERHPTGPEGVEAFLHDDASRMFPRVPPALLPDICLNTAKFENNPELQSKQPECNAMNAEDLKNGLPCHEFVTGVNATAKYMGEFEVGVLAHDGAVLLESPFTFWVSIHDRVYNVTEYVNDIRNEQTKQIEKDHPNAYLEPTLNNLVINKLNEDATELFLSVYPDDRVLACMDELFYVGIIDTRFDVVCFVLNCIMYFLLCFVALIMIAQMLCSLMYIAKGTRTYSEEDTQDQVIVMVPCYNEGGKELIKTIDSILGTTYPEENKVVFIIADGVVTGAGQDMSTPEHLAEILGFEMDVDGDELYDYDSIGLITSNRARVYHGYYEVEDRSLKYLVVVKHGLPMEQAGSAKPGNRGKRDSQLIIMGYFNRIYHGRELTELDAAIEDALIDLNMQSDDMRLLMTIDADTRVEEMSITHMTYAMNQNERILALCGETKVDNKWQSWVTMMQVFEYYNNHHMKKGFESSFGCVTCLPGCFTMYRILNDDGKPLLADDHVYAEYLRNDIDSLHEQNLFHLGEDRMLTTLLLHFFPGMFLSYVPEAQCHTIVPHSIRILLSQRRRWINSTYHNLLELTKVKTMCGVCCCSMKTVVYLDLIACMILPASTVYAAYLIFLVAAGQTQFSLLLLVLYGLIIGVQLVVFILRSRYDFLFWFVYFTLIGVPFFYFFLPLYAFWHMDDFSWGETRKVAAMKQSFSSPNKAIENGDADYDSESTGESDEEGSEYYDNDDGEEEGYSRRGDGDRSQYSRRSGEGSRYSSSRRG